MGGGVSTAFASDIIELQEKPPLVSLNQNEEKIADLISDLYSFASVDWNEFVMDKAKSRTKTKIEKMTQATGVYMRVGMMLVDVFGKDGKNINNFNDVIDTTKKIMKNFIKDGDLTKDNFDQIITRSEEIDSHFTKPYIKLMLDDNAKILNKFLKKIEKKLSKSEE